METMQIYPFAGIHPDLGRGVFIAPGAIVIGEVKIGNNSSLWFNSVARGDCNAITIGENTNIQDLCMLHVTEEYELIIGSNVSIGHSVTLHGCEVKDSCLIGMGATLLDGAIINKESIVAAGSLVPPGKEYPEGMMIMGSPAKAVRELTAEEKTMASQHYKSYLGYKKEFQTDESFIKALQEHDRQ